MELNNLALPWDVLHHLGSFAVDVCVSVLLRMPSVLPVQAALDNGFGLRSRAATAPAAFCGRVLAVAAAMFEVAPAAARDVFGV